MQLLVATRDLKNSPVFTDLSIQPRKMFIALGTVDEISTNKFFFDIRI